MASKSDKDRQVNGREGTQFGETEGWIHDWGMNECSLGHEHILFKILQSKGSAPANDAESPSRDIDSM